MLHPTFKGCPLAASVRRDHWYTDCVIIQSTGSHQHTGNRAKRVTRRASRDQSLPPTSEGGQLEGGKRSFWLHGNRFRVMGRAHILHALHCTALHSPGVLADIDTEKRSDNENKKTSYVYCTSKNKDFLLRR